MENILNCTGHELKIPRIVKAQGVYLTDDKGRRYVDMESGVWCAALGHNAQSVNLAMQKQAGSLMHAGYCYSHEVVDRAGGKVLSLAGMEGGGCVFLCSGSEAIELARQIAKHVSGKSRSMTLRDSYLGSYSSVTNRSKGWHLFDWTRCASCAKQDGCDPDCDLVAAIPRDISEFIFEPGSSGGWVRFPPRAVIKRIVQKVKANQGIIIVNEVTTGIGRTGKWFGHQHYDIQPDIIAMGKGIGNGYPVSATAISQAVLAQLEGLAFKYMQSHQNDPMGAAVALEVLSAIEEQDLVSQAARKGEALKTRLTGLIDGKSLLAVRGRGLMLAVDLASASRGDAIFERLLESGYIVCNRKGLFRIDPPLITPDEVLDGFTAAFAKALG